MVDIGLTVVPLSHSVPQCLRSGCVNILSPAPAERSRYAFDWAYGPDALAMSEHRRPLE